MVRVLNEAEIMCTRGSITQRPRIQHSIVYRNPEILYPMNRQNVDVRWEFIPDDTCIPVTESFGLLRVDSECPELPCDGGLEFVVAEGLKGFGYARVCLFI